MKLAVAIAPEDAPPSAFVVFRGIKQSIEKAAALGYHGIELALSSASNIDGQPLDQLLQAHNMAIAAISTGLVYAQQGCSLLETPDRALPIFREMIDVAARYGCHVNIGRARGFRREQTPAQAADRFREILLPLCEYADRHSVTLLLEPVNRYEIDWIHSVADGASMLAQMGLSNVGLMPDVFHMNIEDAQIGQSLIDYADHIRYIHLADSNRLSPGEGHLDFDEVFSALAKIGYDGWASVEILPQPDPDTAAARAAAFLLPRLRTDKNQI